MMQDYKKIADYNKQTRHNEKNYFHLQKVEKQTFNLLRRFYEDVYDDMHEFCKDKPTINPPH